MLKEWQENRKEKAEQKKQALRERNAELRAQGKEPLKGWGKMVDTGLGGANKANPIDTKVFVGETQKRISDESRGRKTLREEKEQESR